MNLKKKIMALVMACVLALSMATSAFASYSNEAHGFANAILGMHCVYDKLGESKGHLNLQGEGVAYTNRNVTVYSRTSSADQLWYPDSCASGSGRKFYSGQTSSDGRKYALNINNSTGNCNIYPDLASNDRDSLIVIKPTGDPANVWNNIQIVLAASDHNNKVLDVSGTNVVWRNTGTQVTWTRCA